MRFPSTRKGTSLVEITMAAGIMAAAMVPIAYYFYSSGQQQARMKAESVAAAYAAKLMNEWLDEKLFVDVVTTGPETYTDIEGVKIEWKMDVVDISPSAITFTWDPSAGPAGGSSPPMTADILDAKNASKPAIKDLKLTVQWQSPRDATMGGPSRTQILITRRAQL